MSPALQAVLIIALGVSGCVGYFFLSNLLLDKVLFPARGPHIGRNVLWAGRIRPWLFLLPALIALGLYLAYPVVETLRLSLTERLPGNTYAFVGFDNYRQMLGEAKFWESMRNNMLWLIVVPAASTALGLLAAQLTDRIAWGNIAKSLIFMPMAISFVGASVIWKLIYDSRPAGQAQIGLLNALWLRFEGGWGSFALLKALPMALLLTFLLALLFALRQSGRSLARQSGLSLPLLLQAAFFWLLLSLSLFTLQGLYSLSGAALPFGQEQAWLTLPYWNNFFLMAVLVWIQTGFAMVILSAALRGVPEETIEAAILDGANPFQIFFWVKVPQIRGTILVVWTTITIVVLKVFDIVLAMTNGQWESQVLANYMFDKMFRANDWGVGSASAMVIMLLVTPILIWNVANARREMR